jgi:hypothetical protein
MRKWFGVTAEVPIELNQSPSIRSSTVRHLFTVGLAGFLLLSSGCGSSPEQLAKDYAAAMKNRDAQQIAAISEKVQKLTPEEGQRFVTALSKEMLGMGQEMMNGLKNMGNNPFGGAGFGGGGPANPGGMPKTPANQGDFFGGNK